MNSAEVWFKKFEKGHSTHNLADNWRPGCAYHCPFDLAWRSLDWTAVWFLYDHAIEFGKLNNERGIVRKLYQTCL